MAIGTSVEDCCDHKLVLRCKNSACDDAARAGAAARTSRPTLDFNSVRSVKTSAWRRKFVGDQRRLTRNRRNDGHPDPTTLQRLDQRAEIAVTGEQHNLVDVFSELQGIDREKKQGRHFRLLMRGTTTLTCGASARPIGHSDAFRILQLVRPAGEGIPTSADRPSEFPTKKATLVASPGPHSAHPGRPVEPGRHIRRRRLRIRL